MTRTLADWEQRRRIAIEAWELGKRLMVPRPLRPVRPPRGRIGSVTHSHLVSWFHRDPGGGTIYVKPEPDDVSVARESYWWCSPAGDVAMPLVDPDLSDRVRGRVGVTLREATDVHSPARRVYLNARTPGTTTEQSE